MTTERNAPTIFVSVLPEGGTADEVDISNRVTMWEFVDAESGVDKLTLSIDNFDLALFDDPILAKGNIVRFSFGYVGEMSPVRETVIRKSAGGRTINVVAHSKSVLMDTLHKQRSFTGQTHAEIVRTVAAENGYKTDDVLFIEETVDRPEIVVQANYTDAQFLRKLASINGFEFFVDFDGFHWHPRRVGQKPLFELVYYTDPRAGDILDFNVENDLTRLPGKVTVKSRNPDKKQTISESADNESDRDRDVLGSVLLAMDKVTGSLVKNTRTAQEATLPDNSQSEAEAKSKAKGKFRKSQQRAVKMTLNLVGKGRLLAKSVIRVRGMGKRLSGPYYVKTATHRGDASGFRTDANVISDGANAAFADEGSGSASSAAVATHVVALENAIVSVPVFVDTSAVRNLIDVAERFAADQTKANAQATLNASRAVIGNAATVPSISVPTNELRALAARTLSSLSAPAIARINRKQVDQKDKENKKLGPKIVRDRATGQTITRYPDQGGREN